MDSAVLGWAFYDGSAGSGPQPTGEPPYDSGVAALVDRWRLLQMSPLTPPASGHERQTSYLKHEFVFERLVESEPGRAAIGLPN